MKSKGNITVKGLKVVDGYIHPIVGDISGWEGTALRYFNFGGIDYVDMRFTASTLKNVSLEERKEFFEKRVIFSKTRIRVDKTIETEVVTSGKVDLQNEWFEMVGSYEIDPTAVLSNSESNGPSIIGRREFLSFAVIGISAAILMSAAATCNENAYVQHDNWGREGFSS